MAKNSKSKSKAKLKLPKEVAGVKVPKGLRKQGKRLLGLIDTPAGRELAATGLTLAAASLVAKTSDGKSRGAVKAVGREVVSKAKAGESEIADLGAILSAAVAEGARRFLQGFEEGKQAKSSPQAGALPVRPAGQARRAGSADRKE